MFLKLHWYIPIIPPATELMLEAIRFLYYCEFIILILLRGSARFLPVTVRLRAFLILKQLESVKVTTSLKFCHNELVMEFLLKSFIIFNFFIEVFSLILASIPMDRLEISLLFISSLFIYEGPELDKTSYISHYI